MANLRMDRPLLAFCAQLDFLALIYPSLTKDLSLNSAERLFLYSVRVLSQNELFIYYFQIC